MRLLVLSNGVTELAHRPLARALNTNARMLLYHFGSREGLLREVLAGLREREEAVIRSWFRQGEKRTLAEFLLWYWKRLSARRARPAARLIFELYALALRQPHRYPGVLTEPLSYWRNLSERAGVTAEAGPAQATLLLAATRGLLLDLCATGDSKRIADAIKLLAAMVESSARTSA